MSGPFVTDYETMTRGRCTSGVEFLREQLLSWPDSRDGTQRAARAQVVCDRIR